MERVVPGAAGDSIGPSIQADLKEDENQVTFEEILREEKNTGGAGNNGRRPDACVA